MRKKNGNNEGTLLTPLASLSETIADSYSRHLLKYSVIRKVKAGSILFYEGDYCNEIFYLLSGKVKLSSCYPHGSELILSIYERKSIFGLSMLDDKKHFATAVAMVDSEIAVISATKLIEEASNNPTVFMAIIKSINAEVRKLVGQISCIALTDASARIVRFLNIFSYNNQTSNKNYIECTHDNISNMLGLSRSVVTSTLNSLEKAGIIKKDRSKITIVDTNKLNMLLEDKNNIRDRIIG